MIVEGKFNDKLGGLERNVQTDLGRLQKQLNQQPKDIYKDCKLEWERAVSHRDKIADQLSTEHNRQIFVKFVNFEACLQILTKEVDEHKENSKHRDNEQKTKFANCEQLLLSRMTNLEKAIVSEGTCAKGNMEMMSRIINELQTVKNGKDWLQRHIRVANVKIRKLGFWHFVT